MLHRPSAMLIFAYDSALTIMDKVFYHCPNIGDIVFALPVIRHLGGGTLLLDPASNPAYEPTFRQAISFFKRQPYIKDCRLYNGERWDYNLDEFRNVPNWWRMTLVESHFRCIGMTAPNPLIPWLTAEKHSQTYPVVIHRSDRYHGEVDYMFLHRIRRGDLFCIGYEEEITDFRDILGATWIPTPTFDDVAAVINSCGVFIGNQSSPVTIAVGLGRNRLIEECPWIPVSIFDHENEFVMGMDPEANFQALCQSGYDPSGTTL